MKKIIRKIKEFFTLVYNGGAELDREGFAPYVSLTSLAIYFLLVLIFMPWTGAIISNNGVKTSVSSIVIVSKIFYLVAAFSMFIFVFFARINKLKTSFVVFSIILFFVGCLLSTINKFSSYQNFYLNMDFLNIILMLIASLIVIASLYKKLDKRRAKIYLYGITGIALIAGIIPNIITGDGSAIIYAFRDYAPYSLIYLAFGAFCHGLKVGSESNV